MFMLHGMLDLDVSIIALGGAAVLLVITGIQPFKALHHVEWPTLLFFCGLFVIVGGVEVSGALELLAHNILEITEGDLGATMFSITIVSAFASAFVDNIPFTATMIPIVESISVDPMFAQNLTAFDYNPLWYALAFGADLGGNGTLIGASANLVAILDGELFEGADGVKRLSALPTKDEAQATIVQLVLSPAGNVVKAMTSPGGNVLGIIKEIRSRLEDGNTIEKIA